MKTIGKEIRVLLADDHQIVLDGLAQLLEKRFDLIGLASTGLELVTLAKRHKPDVIVADINMPGMDGIDAVREIRASGLMVKTVFLTMLAEPKTAIRAFQTGGDITGYVLKSSAGSELITAIQEVLAGRSYITPRITSDVLHECLQNTECVPEGLTNRQTEVLRLIAQGKTMKEVAAALEISTRTAEAHKYQMMQQLGIKTSAELVQFAIQQGLVRLPPPVVFPNYPTIYPKPHS